MHVSNGDPPNLGADVRSEGALGTDHKEWSLGRMLAVVRMNPTGGRPTDQRLRAVGAVARQLEPHQAAERTLRRILAGFGLHEAWTSSFGSPQELDALGLAEDHPARTMLMLSNPTSEDQPAMRSTLLPGLLRAAARNVAQGSDSPALFEVARIYEPTGETLPREPLVVGAVNLGVKRIAGFPSEFLVLGALVSGLFGGLAPWDGRLSHGLALGLVVAIMAPVGDLCESMIKRDLGVKDLGTILPGHGGILDRFDAILFCLPAVYYLVIQLEIG